jgi:hypothetical protein
MMTLRSRLMVIIGLVGTIGLPLSTYAELTWSEKNQIVEKAKQHSEVKIRNECIDRCRKRHPLMGKDGDLYYGKCVTDCYRQEPRSRH